MTNITNRGGDAIILAAWTTRQGMLAQIERNGSFYNARSHSPALNSAYDAAEMCIHETPAHTIAGALAKAWVALSHMRETLGGDAEGARDRHAIILRANVADVAAIIEECDDFAISGAFRAIQSLAALADDEADPGKFDDRTYSDREALQEGVSCTLATLAAIRNGSLLDTAPEDAEAAKGFGHALWLLFMLEEKLTAVQQAVDSPRGAKGA